MREPLTGQALIKFLESQGYWNIRELPDGIVCNAKMIFTTALLIDVTEHCYDHRYCFEKQADAEAACLAMNSIDDEVQKTYVKRKG